MYLVRTVAPTVPSVTAATVKANKRVSHTSEDTLIQGYIAAAEDVIERSTNRAIMRQTFKLVVPAVRPVVTLFRPPMEGEIGGIVSAKSIVGGFTTVLAHGDAVIGSEASLPTASFAEITDVDSGSMEITYETGAEDATKVPPGIRQAVLLLSSHYYSNREESVLDPRARGGKVSIPYGVEKFISLYRIPNVNMPVNEAA